MRKNRFWDVPYIQNLVGDAIEAAIVASLRGLIEAADPNWCCLKLQFDEGAVLTDRQLSCRIDPVRVWVNGPRDGDVLLDPAAVCSALDDFLMIAARILTAYNRHWLPLRIDNPDHHPEVIVDRTIFYFEHCDHGVADARAGNSFHVVSLEFEDQGYDYTMEQLMDELSIDPQVTQSFGEVVYLEYLPRLHPDDNGRFETVEQLLEYYDEQARLAVERGNAEIARREAEEAAAEAALTPEQRAARDAETERLVASTADYDETLAAIYPLMTDR